MIQPRRNALALSAGFIFAANVGAGQSVFLVDAFNATGNGTNNYLAGQVTNVWGNWFGGAFQSLSWDGASDASNVIGSGSLRIDANFNGGNNQFAVYDFNGIYPPVNGTQYTNFQCNLRFAPSSATVVVAGQTTFGYLQFGVTDGYSQNYFGGVLVPSSATNWTKVSLPINPASNPSLSNICNLIIHIYGPYYSPGLNGASTLWVDNIQFTGAPYVNTNCIINWNDVHQRIDGFGASSAWDGSWTAAQADMFFSTNNGIGLSLLRTRIAPGGTTVEGGIAQMAQARGASVWSTPWSPQASFKDSGNVNGGNFVSSDYSAYAAQLAGYVVNMKNTYGVNLYAVSVQNEPNVSTSYESCVWTAQQIHDFVPYLHAALVAGNVASTRIVLAEDESWETNLYGLAMSDPATATNVGIYACHNYDGTPPSGNPPALPGFVNTNAARWETEVSTFDAFDGSITNAMYWAERIHLFMTAAEVNAFHYWWLIPFNPDNQGLTDPSGNPAKRMYVLGNYSRFVRPGFYRIGVTNNTFTLVSAYKNPTNGNFAIIAANLNATNVTQTFNLSGFTTGSVTPWVTDATRSLVAQAPVSVANSSYAYALPPLSVVTFVGNGFVLPTQIQLTNAVVSNNHIVLRWNSVAGATYSILKTNRFIAGGGTNWLVITTGYPIGGAPGGTLSYTDATVLTGSNFYRLRSP